MDSDVSSAITNFATDSIAVFSGFVTNHIALVISCVLGATALLAVWNFVRIGKKRT